MDDADADVNGHTLPMVETTDENGHSLPSVEEAKLNASATSPVSGNAKREKIFKIAAVAVVLLVLIIGISVGVTGNRNDSNSVGSSQPEESRFDEVVDFLKQFSSEDALLGDDSPQNAAAAWMADGDEAQYDIPDSSSSAEGIRFIERYALATFYFALNGDDWTFSHHFLSDRSACEWRNTFAAGTTDFEVGIRCKSGRVVYIFLPGNDLEGELPAEIGLLTELEHLSVFDNEINGELPKEMRELTKLKFLALDGNYIEGNVEDWFGNFDRLEFLNLGENLFTGTLPASLNGMTSLKQLVLESNYFEGGIDVFETITSLDTLIIGENGFQATLDDDSFSSMTELAILDLSSNLFDGGIPYHIFESNYMEIVDFHNNTFSTGLPEEPMDDDNDRLTFLALQDNNFEEPIPEAFKQLKALRHLDLSGNNFNGVIPEFLNEMTTLTYLFLAENNFDKGPFPNFRDLTKLTELSLKRNRISDTIPNYLGDLTDLVFLDLNQNELYGELPHHLQALENLQFLIINANRDLTGTVPPSWQKLTSLTVFLMEKTGLEGDVNFFCPRNDGFEYFVADCGGDDPQIDCDPECCTHCCEPGVGGCFEEDWRGDFEGDYDNGYKRDMFVFSENIEFAPREEYDP